MMKSRLWLVGLVALWTWGAASGAAQAVPAGGLPAAGGAAAEEVMEASYLQDIAFERLPGKERIILAFSRESGAMIESKNSHSVVAIMANTYIPEDMRRAGEEVDLDNVYRVSTSQQDKDGQPWGYITMDMRERVPYMVRKDGARILIDFNVAGLAGRLSPRVKTNVAAADRQATPAVSDRGKTMAAQALTPQNATQAAGERRISIDFQEANIKSVLRLLAEEGGVSIASGDDVKGNVTLTLKRVTWDEAFETVLMVQGLGRVREGNVLIVKTVDRMRKEEKTKADEAEDRLKRQKLQEMADQEKRVKDGKLPQISIEAKIVEVSRSGSRSLGILWGAAWTGSEVGFNVGSGARGDNTTTQKLFTANPKWDNAGVAVNFPSGSYTANPALGVIVATSNLLLSAKLEALETSGNGRIISSPRVTTLDNEKAKIGQGEEIPYVTRDKDGTPTVEMKDAKLELEVIPKITAEGKISMEIKCDSKAADWEKVNRNNENPPLVSSNVESKVVVSDGDTIVLGGIMKTMVTKSVSAVPWVSKIPVLGWLFKQEGDKTEERELLIFVTPRIVRS